MGKKKTNEVAAEKALIDAGYRAARDALELAKAMLEGQLQQVRDDHQAALKALQTACPHANWSSSSFHACCLDCGLQDFS